MSGAYLAHGAVDESIFLVDASKCRMNSHFLLYVINYRHQLINQLALSMLCGMLGENVFSRISSDILYKYSWNEYRP